MRQTLLLYAVHIRAVAGSRRHHHSQAVLFVCVFLLVLLLLQPFSSSLADHLPMSVAVKPTWVTVAVARTKKRASRPLTKRSPSSGTYDLGRLRLCVVSPSSSLLNWGLLAVESSAQQQHTISAHTMAHRRRCVLHHLMMRPHFLEPDNMTATTTTPPASSLLRTRTLQQPQLSDIAVVGRSVGRSVG